jgi:hypothetical protein
MRRETVQLIRYANAGNVRSYVLVNNRSERKRAPRRCRLWLTCCLRYNYYSHSILLR